MQIIAGGLEHPQVQALLEAHLRSSQLALGPPAACTHSNLDALRHPSIRFWAAWNGEELDWAAVPSRP